MTDPTPDETPNAPTDETASPDTLEETGLEATLEADSAEAGDVLREVEEKAAEHLADLQRLQAEYVNYRKRVERDKGAVVDLAVARVVEALIPTLDDIAAARNHGELEGPFAAIADKLEASLERLGLVTYGSVGEPFDPSVHEALASIAEVGLESPTIREVSQAGHRIGDRILRPARVVVAQPE